MMETLESELYGALAEVLSDPPDWLALPGSEWPLYLVAKDLTFRSSKARQAIERMKAIPPELIAKRQERYNALFSGAGRPRFWLHESLYRSGRLFGSETMEVEGIYRTAKLVIDGAELPDHASIELAFLAYVVNMQAGSNPQCQAWEEIERDFILTHAGQWLPALGLDLAACGDEVYAPIGQLLVSWLIDRQRPVKTEASLLTAIWIPILPRNENCSLCGFCVQVCPNHILRIQENSGETVLLRSQRQCSGCKKCVTICPEQALRVSHFDNGAGISDDRIVLRSSPRAHCPRCGQPTVSQAEIECIEGKVGQLPWIELCQGCRLSLMETVK